MHSKEYGRAYYRGRTLALKEGKSTAEARAAGRAAAQRFRSQAPTDSPSDRPFQRGAEGGVSEGANVASNTCTLSPPGEAPRFKSGDTFCSGCGQPLDLFIVPHGQKTCWDVHAEAP